jgi:hypothetical protein
MVADQATRPPAEGHDTTKERSVPGPAGGDGGRRAADAPRSCDTGFQSGGSSATAAPQAPQVEPLPHIVLSLITWPMLFALQVTTSFTQWLHACAVAPGSKTILHSVTITVSRSSGCTAGVDEDGWPRNAPDRRSQQGANFCRPLAAPPGAPSHSEALLCCNLHTTLCKVLMC